MYNGVPFTEVRTSVFCVRALAKPKSHNFICLSGPAQTMHSHKQSQEFAHRKHARIHKCSDTITRMLMHGVHVCFTCHSRSSTVHEEHGRLKHKNRNVSGMSSLCASSCPHMCMTLHPHSISRKMFLVCAFHRARLCAQECTCTVRITRMRWASCPCLHPVGI